ncbi:MAG: TonB-dependent receptor plug domain-containing protein, partial [Pseudoxanthomonas sp.]
SRSDWLLLRGFTAARYLDGLALAEGSRTGINRAEPSGLENIEVLKGPSSVSYGAMPGGLVNYVSKRATEEGAGTSDAVSAYTSPMRIPIRKSPGPAKH